MLNLLIALFLFLSPSTTLVTPDGGPFVFKTVKTVPTTSVKNQAQTGTCWCFASVSFLESEMMRMGKDSLDIAEMFFVHNNYLAKARNYVSRQTQSAYGEGSVSQDVFRMLKKEGLVPQSAYPGTIEGQSSYNHAELQSGIKGYLDVIAKEQRLTNVWPDVVDAMLDTYLGAPPTSFQYRGRTYTPQTFAKETGLVADDYIELTSYTHHPFYAPFALEIPDNWANNQSWNVPVDELVATIDNALENGFSVVWDADVSERTFCHDRGVAVLPAVEWQNKSEAQRSQTCVAPETEMTVTQEMRQRMFEDHTTTDDHLMHFTGIATDQNGARYYRTKNSWGTQSNTSGGYLNVSVPYVRAKTVAIIVHKDALPASLRQKLMKP